MFILKRQDVEISSFHHPTKDQNIPILIYQDQTFRLLSVFSAAQEEEARALWRDLTDHRGKACVLLEEPDRFSVWGKIRLDRSQTNLVGAPTAANVVPVFILGCVVMLQALYEDIVDLMGAKQAQRFATELTSIAVQLKLPQAGTPQAINTLLLMDPFSSQLPAWEEDHLNLLLKELHRMSKTYFGKSNFAERALLALEEIPVNERTAFLNWLKQSPHSKLWQ